MARARSTSANLNYPRTDGKAVTCGDGFEIRTDARLALRSAMGLLITLVGIKVPSDMLHLELYGTTESPRKTALSQKGTPPYQRRGDLFDSTPSIDIAEMK